MKILTVASLKGGVGKTSLAVFLAQALAVSGRRVLAIDADPNNNLSDYFLRDADADVIERANLYHVLTGKAKAPEATFPTAFNLDVLPCTPKLHVVGVELASDPAALLRFGASLRKLDYDFAVIDTPPALTFELRAGLYAATEILSPVSLSRWTAQALDLLRLELDKVAELAGKTTPLRAVPCIVTDKEREKLSFTAALKPYLTKTGISKTALVKGAGNTAKRLSEKSRSWTEFVALAGEVA